MSKENEPFVERMIEEYNDLYMKCVALEKFTKSKKFKELKQDESYYLGMQYAHMLQYRDTLQKRIELYEGEDDE